MGKYVRKSESEKKLNEENLERAGGGRKSSFKTLTLLPMAVALFIVPAFATSGDSSTGLSAVLAQSTNASTLIGAVFDLITGNQYLALCMLFGLMAAALRLFRRGKRAAR